MAALWAVGNGGGGMYLQGASDRIVPTHLSLCCVLILEDMRSSSRLCTSMLTALQMCCLGRSSRPDSSLTHKGRWKHLLGSVVWGKGHHGEKLNMVYEECCCVLVLLSQH